MYSFFQEDFSTRSALFPPVSPLLLLVALSFVIGGCGSSGGNDTSPPAAPTELRGTSQDGAIALEWGTVSADDLNGYNVYRSRDSISSVDATPPLNEDTPVPAADYIDASAENGTTYHYVVTAVDEAGNESPPSSNVTKTPFETPPNRP